MSTDRLAAPSSPLARPGRSAWLRAGLRGARVAGVIAAALAAGAAAAAVDLADQPLFSTVSVPGNVILSLSVEYPTANTPAYFSSSAYAAASTYLGLFDPAKCYRYNAVNSGTTLAPNYSTSYFEPYSLATSHACSSNAALSLWSGNYLNWASTQTLDAFRWVLTGGNRAIDTPTLTVLEKTYHSGQDGGGNSPNKAISTGVSGATPLNWGTVNTRTSGIGVRMFVSGATMASSGAPVVVDYTGQNSYNALNLAASPLIYALYMRVKVCDSAVSLESNCVAYGSNYKPEGLMQKYATKLRFSAFGYLNDGNVRRDGGVMRARMKYIGPQQPVPGSDDIGNGAAEWSASTGVMNANPDPADASATTSASGSAGYSVTITQSGVMNYLNKFGNTALSYKTYDPVSELYYSGLRYLKNLGNVPEYSSLAGAGSAATMKNWLDGFPVISTWSDPILYTCQKNFILGIGDVNTHRDANLYGSTIRSGDEPTMPSSVSADTSINVKTATDMVGKLEGIASLGSTYIPGGRYDAYFMAGLAYDAHTRDMRSDLEGSQTVNTYWLDVLEGQTYSKNNIYYLATKYGGFTVPAGFDPYAAGNGTSTIGAGTWRTNNDTLGSGTNSNPRPDNYYTANNADVMKSGLTAAFAKISSENEAATSAAYSTVSPNVTTSGSISYATTYDPTTWTGRVLASSVTYNSSGTPTFTPAWDARALLSASTVTATTRKIVTCCTSTGAALPFTATALGAATLNSRTNYASFSAVPGVDAAAQSAADFVAYLRGDKSDELANGGVYRNRGFRLGDIVNARPVAVGAPASGYYDLYNPGYSSFKRSYAARKTVVYAGANDGMLHAFDGSIGNAASGSELFAYVPSFVYGSSTTAPVRGLASLGNPSFNHHYFVDATPAQFDVDLNKTSGASGSPDWRTLLIGGLGKGGKGYYAIDVTDPAAWTSETAVASKVLWEFSDARLGYGFGQPSLVKTSKYGWVVLLTSGYDNSDGLGYLFFVNPRNGALLEAVATTSGSLAAPIDMAHHAAFVASYADGTADAVYAGDLRGNVWRFDVTGATGSYPSPLLMGTLRNAAGTAQPVTTKPLVEIEPKSKKRYLLMGTGALLADSDIATTSVQSFYAIVDGNGASGGFNTTATLPAGVTFPLTRGTLRANTDLLRGVGTPTGTSMGWYYDLPVSGGSSQRVDVDPTANQGIVAFIGNVPSGSVCKPSGTGTLYAVNWGDGTSVLKSASGTLIASSTPIAGILTDVTIQRVSGTLRLFTGGSTGEVVNAPAALSSGTGIRQLNWRDVPMAD